MVGKNLAEKIEAQNLDYEAIYEYERYLIPIRRLCPGIDRRFGWEGSNLHHKAPCDWLKHYAPAFHFCDAEIWAARTTADMPSASGVYFLFRGDVCIYIGQTGCLFDRAVQHKRNRLKWTSHAYFEAPKMHAPAIEAYYIRRLEPPLNSLISALTDYSSIVEELGLDG